MMTHLGLETVTNTLTAPSTLYAAATYGPSGLALLLVNANMTRAVSLNLLHSGILSGAMVGVEQWLNGSSGPTNSSFALSTSYRIPALSITILTVGLVGLGPASQTGVPFRHRKAGLVSLGRGLHGAGSFPVALGPCLRFLPLRPFSSVGVTRVGAGRPDPWILALRPAHLRPEGPVGSRPMVRARGSFVGRRSGARGHGARRVAVARRRTGSALFVTSRPSTLFSDGEERGPVEPMRPAAPAMGMPAASFPVKPNAYRLWQPTSIRPLGNRRSRIEPRRAGPVPK